MTTIHITCWITYDGLVLWWRHQMETFSALVALHVGNSPLTGEFPAQRPVTRSFDVFFDLHPNKGLSKQWWGRWFETPSRQLWRHCNGHPMEHGPHCYRSWLVACSAPRHYPKKNAVFFFYWKPWEQISVKFESKYKTFHWRKCISKCRLQKGIISFLPPNLSPPLFHGICHSRIIFVCECRSSGTVCRF